MFRISSLKEAREVRDDYIKREETLFAALDQSSRKNVIQLSQEKEAKEKAAIAFNELTDKEKERVSQLAHRIQKAWKNQTSTDTLFPVNPEGAHSAYVNNMLNHQTTVKKNINTQKQADLLLALKEKNYQDPIFTDPLFIQTAMALVTSDKITPAVFETLLGRYQASRSMVPDKPYTLTTYPILDNQGEFTTDANKRLLPNLDGFMKKTFLSSDSDFINHFKFLLQAFFERYPSENFFYTMIINYDEYQSDELAYRFKKSYLASAIYDCEDSLLRIHLSSTAQLVARLAAFGRLDMVPTYMMLGVLTIEDIEAGVTLGFRPKAGSYPYVPQHENIHGCRYLLEQTKGDHDNYHADMMSRLGKVIRESLLHSVDVIRRDLLRHIPNLAHLPTKKLFSKTVWKMIDAEFGYFNKPCLPRCETAEEVSLAFSRMVDADISSLRGIYIDIDSKLNDTGIVCMIDMALHENDWLNIGLYPNFMGDPYKGYLDFACKLKPYYKADDSLYNIFLYRVLWIMGKDALPIWSSIINRQYDAIKNNFVFKRDNRIYFLGVFNTKANLSLKDSTIATLFDLLSIPHLPRVLENQQLNVEICKLLNLSAKLYLFSANNQFIHKHIIMPICQCLLQALETKQAIEYKKIEDVYIQLKQWIDTVQKNKNKQEFYQIPAEFFEIVSQEMNAILQSHKDKDRKPLIRTYTYTF